MEKSPAYCSFCGTHHDEKDVVIAGHDVYICDDCVILCVKQLMCETTKDNRAKFAKKVTNRFIEPLIELFADG